MKANEIKKKTLYKISDPALSFWYRVYSPHRSTWEVLKNDRKMELIYGHAGTVLEAQFRSLYPGASSYWESSDIEFDSVRFIEEDRLMVSEIKLGDLAEHKKSSLLEKLKIKAEQSKLSKKYKKINCEVLGWKDVLARLDA